MLGRVERGVAANQNPQQSCVELLVEPRVNDLNPELVPRPGRTIRITRDRRTGQAMAVKRMPEEDPAC